MVKGANRAQILKVVIANSILWEAFTVSRFTENMRLRVHGTSLEKRQYAAWLESIGDGSTVDADSTVLLPEAYRGNCDGSVESIVSSIYGGVSTTEVNHKPSSAFLFVRHSRQSPSLKFYLPTTIDIQSLIVIPFRAGFGGLSL